MTANLVSYWRQKEDARHNEQQEKLTAAQTAELRRHNMAMEKYNQQQIAYSYAQLAEVTRHNQALETQQIKSNIEIYRHNREIETLNTAQQKEMVRHNTEMETLESREVFTKQRRQDLDEQKFEFQKEAFVIEFMQWGVDTSLKATDLLTKLFTRGKSTDSNGTKGKSAGTKSTKGKKKSK